VRFFVSKKTFLTAAASAAVLATGVIGGVAAVGMPADATALADWTPGFTGPTAKPEPTPAQRAARKQRAKHARQLKHVLPYEGGGRRWALPYNVVVCESGASFSPHSGAYGIIDSTWVSFGGTRYAPYPGAATPWQQSVITAKVRDFAGPSGWSCW
jgi:hypothetical protein